MMKKLRYCENEMKISTLTQRVLTVDNIEC